VNYNKMLEGSRAIIVRLNEFLGGVLDVANMAEVIDPNLHRQRKV
jgi:hypothetical protein